MEAPQNANSYTDIIHLPSQHERQSLAALVVEDVTNDAFTVVFRDETLARQNDQWSVWTVDASSCIPTIAVMSENTRRRPSEVLWITLYWYFQNHALHEEHAPTVRKTPKKMRSLKIEESGILTRDVLLGLAQNNLIDIEYQPASRDEGSTTRLDGREQSEMASRYFFTNEPAFWQLPIGYFCDFAEAPVCPKPAVYTLSNSTIRHPRRSPAPRSPKPFYSRHIITSALNSIFTLRPCLLSDAPLLHTWMNNPRVAAFWGEDGPLSHQEKFIANGLKSAHSFPAIGSWEDFEDGRSKGVKDACFFEVYWVKEDHLARYADHVGDWDRGVHVLVGEDWARGRVNAWMSSLVHYMFLDDPRTQCLYLEPRVDNTRFIDLLVQNGFHKEKEFAFPHKQAALMRLKREAWEGVRDENIKP